MNKGSEPIRVFVSYAHEHEIDGHRARALELTQSLRDRGLEAIIDQFYEHNPPIWPRWMLDEIKRAEFVLCLASPAYKKRAEADGDLACGRGVRWEGAIITEELYAGFPHSQGKFVAVVLDRCSHEDIPDLLFPIGRSYYYWPKGDEDLYRRLTGQPRVMPRPVRPSIIELPRHY